MHELLKLRLSQENLDLYLKVEKLRSNDSPGVKHYPIYNLEHDTEMTLSYPDSCSNYLFWKKYSFDCEPTK